MVHKETYVTYKNKLLKIIKQRKLQYYSDLITKNMLNCIASFGNIIH